MQEVAVSKAIDYFNSTNKKDEKPVIMVAPTAYGKSIIISELARRIGKVLVIQPSKELLEQNYSKLIALGGEASIYSASMGQKEIGDITYATIGSIKSLGQTFKASGVKCVLLDECHSFVSSSEGMFGSFIREIGVKKVIGLTATPFRLSNYSDRAGNRYSQLNMLTSRKKGCGFFKDIIYCCQIHEIISAGRWSPLTYKHFDFISTLLRVNSTGAEYTSESVELAFKSNDLIGKVKEYVESTSRKHILVFVPTIAGAYEMSAQIKGSMVVHGDLDKGERDYVINSFRNGKCRVVINVNVLSVGFDYTKIDSIVLARPTMSLAWLYQAIGRGTRIDPEKSDCEIADFVAVTKRFGKIENLVIENRYGTYEVFSGTKKLTDVKIEDIEVGEGERVITEAAAGKLMPFGKNQGTPIAKLQTSYMGWMLENFGGWAAYQELKQDFIDELKSRDSF
jgi:DNA repair protein RadD